MITDLLNRSPRRACGGALILYLGVSVAYFGWPVLTDLRRYTVGSGADPDLFIWFLAWWPYAIGHGINPFFTTLVWAPDGVNLAWTTSVPAAALPAAPITLAFGPVIAFNILSLLAPALAAWTAFLLCRRVTGSFLPALVGGYFFGFSSYELAHLQGHLNLSLTFVLPLLTLVALLFYEGSMCGRPFVILTALLLAIQFGFSTEMFATATFWAAVAFVIAVALNGPTGRARLMRLAWHAGLAYALAAILLAPYLYYALKGVADLPGLISSPITYSADLLNYVLPTPVTWLGGGAFASVSSRFSGNYAEADAYLGLPLLLILTVYAAGHWRSRRTKVLVVSAAAVLVGSLGPLVHAAGAQSIPMPWALTIYLPLIRHALPSRFTVYLTLIAAVVVALWLSDQRGRKPTWQRWAVVAVAVLFLLPNLGAPGRYARREIPPFFQNGAFRQLGHGENTVVIPYGYTGDSMLWQAVSGLSFPMSGGYLGPLVPRSFAHSFVTYMLYSGAIAPAYRPCLAPFLAGHAVRSVVVAGPNQERWDWLSSQTGGPAVRRDGVTVYRVPSAVPPDRWADPQCTRFLFEQFSDLFQAAERYAARGGRLSALTPLRAEQMGILAPAYGGYADAARENWTELLGWLGPWNSGTVAVGVLGPSDEIAPIIERYRPLATATYFPYPTLFRGPAIPHAYGKLVMIFPTDHSQR